MIIYSKRKGSKFWANIVNFSLGSMIVGFALIAIALGQLSPSKPEVKDISSDVINMRLGDGVAIEIEEISSSVRLRWENRSLLYSIWIERQNSEFVQEIVFPASECLRYCSLIMELPAGTYYWRVIFINHESLVNEVEIDWFTLR